MSEDVDDVRRALTIVFRGADGLARADVERTFSFDMEWVAPNDSEAVVDALLSTGWLEEREHQLHVAVDLGQVDVPFGWFPRPTRLLKPVSATGSGDVPPQIDDSEPSPPSHARTPPTLRTEANISGDPRARTTQRVARFIARQSGLELDELQRRVDRKLKTFHIITPWMAYALVAREQGLPMDDIVKALDAV
ncbi:MAG: DUF2240 family protein [Candidatus Thermoplasmatota archaeon]|nr:DUF2240 family protein [Candidatus Thermoplasmatota archaeon]